MRRGRRYKGTINVVQIRREVVNRRIYLRRLECSLEAELVWSCFLIKLPHHPLQHRPYPEAASASRQLRPPYSRCLPPATPVAFRFPFAWLSLQNRRIRELVIGAAAIPHGRNLRRIVQNTQYPHSLIRYSQQQRRPRRSSLSRLQSCLIMNPIVGADPSAWFLVASEMQIRSSTCVQGSVQLVLPLSPDVHLEEYLFWRCRDRSVFASALSLLVSING